MHTHTSRAHVLDFHRCRIPIGCPELRPIACGLPVHPVFVDSQLDSGGGRGIEERDDCGRFLWGCAGIDNVHPALSRGFHVGDEVSGPGDPCALFVVCLGWRGNCEDSSDVCIQMRSNSDGRAIMCPVCCLWGEVGQYEVVKLVGIS